MIYYKRHTYLDIAHLYEHSFFNHVIKLMNQSDFIYFLDYSIHAETFGHVVVMQLDVYSEPAASRIKDIFENHNELEAKNIELAKKQVNSEEKGTVSWEGVTESSQYIGLTKQAWLTLDDCSVEWQPDYEFKTQLHQLEVEKFKTSHRIEFDINIPTSYLKSDVSNVVLFSYIAASVGELFATELILQNVGAYGLDISNSSNKKIVQSKNSFTIEQLDNQTLNSIGKTVKTKMLSKEYLERLVNYMQKASEKWGFENLNLGLLKNEGFMVGPDEIKRISNMDKASECISKIELSGEVFRNN